MKNNTTINKNLRAALDLLEGKSVVAHDRRAGDAIAIDYTKRRSSGKVQIRPYYGISNTLHKALAKLAETVIYDDRSMPVYVFEAK